MLVNSTTISPTNATIVSLGCNIRPGERGLGPTLSEILECPPGEWFPIAIIGSILTLVIAVRFVLLHRKFRGFYWTNTTLFLLTIRIMGYYLSYALLNLFIILNPRGSQLYNFIGDILEGVAFVVFYHLMWAYAGDYKTVLPKFLGTRVTLGSPPLCCLKCLPKITVTQKFITVNEIMVLQLPAVQIILGLLNITMIINGDFSEADEMFVLVLRILIGLSTPTAIYGLSSLFTMWRSYTWDKNIVLKFLIFKLTIILGQIQGMIFSSVARASKISPHGAMLPVYRAGTWNSFIIIVECVLFICLAGILYKPSDFETDNDQLPSHIVRLENHPLYDQDDSSAGIIPHKYDLSYDNTDLKLKKEFDTLLSITLSISDNESETETK